MLIVFGESSDEVDDEVYRLQREGNDVRGVCGVHGLIRILEKYEAFPCTVIVLGTKADIRLERAPAPCRCELRAEQGRGSA